MIPALTVGIILAVSAAFLWRLFGGIHGSRSTRKKHPNGEIDEAVLTDAEREVRELDAFATPDDAAEEIPDWGPGAPKP